MNYKKLASAALTATTVLWMVGAAALPLANAQTTTSSLAATIASLQAQIASLTAELNSSTSTTTTGTTTGAATYNFTSDLTVGSRGAEVTALQKFLIGQGDLVLATPTQYFGALTQAALAKYQAAHGIHPSVGYFGPMTRAYINSLSTSTTTTTTTTQTLPTGCTSTTGYSPTTGASCAVATQTLPTGCTSTTGYSPTTGVACSTGVTEVTPTGAPMTVAIDPQTPGATNLAQGAVNTPVLKLDFTAGATPVTVTNLVLNRTGLSQDSDLNNVYLYNGATKLASNLGFNNGAITFSNGAGLFTVPANSTYVVTVSVDVSTSAGSGHIFQIGLASANNVTGGTFTGNFPLNSAQFTVAAVSNLAQLTITGQSSSTVDVNAGQTNFLAGQFNVQASNNPVKVTSLSFTNVGSVQSNYLQNIKLMNGSVQLGATVPSLGNSNVVTFDLSNDPLMLTSGQSAVLSLYADITGGVNRTFQFSIQQSSDVQAVDTIYGVGIGASVQSGASFPVDFYNVNINNGGLVVSKDVASPTTYAVAGNTNQILAKFDVLASGDSIKFNELDFGTAGAAIQNFRVVDDQGAQIGTTANVPANGTYKAGSGSLNYIIPANTTRVLTVYGDLASTATGTVAVTFAPLNGASSAQSYTTFASVPVSSVGANTLTVLASGTNLVASLNYGLGSPVQAPAGSSNVKIGSYTFTAGQVNPVTLTGISILTANNATTTPYLRNLRVMDGSTQVGTTQPTVGSNTTYNFNSSAPISIAANGSVTLDVYADINSSVTATTTSAMTTLTAVNASTQSGNAVSIAGSVVGQSVAFSNGGTLTGSISANTPQASYLGMNVTGVEVAQYQFAADTNGSETLTQLNIVDASSTATSTNPATDHSTFINYRLTDTSGNVLSTATENASGTLVFNLSGVNIASGATAYLNLVADVNASPYASSSAQHAFALTSFNYNNASVATTSNVTSNNIGNLFTVYQTTLGVTGAAFANPNSISGIGNIVGEFNFATGNGNTSPIVNSVTLQTQGSIIQASTTQVLGLYNAAAPSVLLASSTVSSTTPATFTMGTNQWTLPINSPNTVLLVKTLSAPTNLVTFSNGSTGSYQVTLTAINWADGTGSDTTAHITSLSPSISMPVASQNITGLTN